MADAVSTWSIDLQDNTSNAAMSAANALKNLQKTIEGDQRALAGMEKALKTLRSANGQHMEQYVALKLKIDAKKKSLAEAQASFIALGGSWDKGKPQAVGLAQRLQLLQQTAQGVPGPIQGVTGAVGQLGSLLAKGGLALGLLAVAAAMAAVTAAAILGTAALLKYGIAAADARRNEALRMEGLTKMRNWWGIAAGNSEEMQSQLDRVSASTALGRDKLEGYQRQLYQMGLRGQNLGLALEAAAIKGSVLGDEGAKSAMHWAAGMALAGGSVKRLTDDIKARFGGVARAQMLSLEVQTAKLRESWDALFTGLKIEGFLRAVQSLTSLFSQSTASGKALKAIMNGLMQPLVAALEWAAPYAKRFFQGLIVGALLLTIVVLKVRNYVRSLFEPDALAAIDNARIAFWGGVVAVGALVGVMALLVGATLLLASPFILVGVGIYYVIKRVAQLYRVFSEVPWASVGKSIVDGLWKGLSSSWNWFVDQVSGLSNDLVNSVKETLGISSPSKVFANLGAAVPAGFAQGIESGAGDVQRASQDMAATSADSAGGARGAGAGGGITIHVGGVNVQSSGAPPQLAQDIEAALIPVFERLALQLGTSPA